MPKRQALANTELMCTCSEMSRAVCTREHLQLEGEVYYLCGVVEGWLADLVVYVTAYHCSMNVQVHRRPNEEMHIIYLYNISTRVD